ncbi:MAG: sortase [Dehalococcoidia bacterium]|nr:sortase [Dehalococcoidia bacterium]
MSTRSDEELVRLAREGADDGLTELYDRYFGAIYDFVIRLVRNREDAEDVTQDTFVKALGSLATLERPEAFRSWLYSVAHHAAVSHIRKRSRQAAPLVTPAAAEPAEDAGERFDVADSDRLGQPATALDLAASAALVWAAASGLEERQYAVLDLNLRRGLESPEIAEVLGVSRNHAAVLLTRAKSSLRTNVTALLLMDEGRRACSGLDAELSGRGIIALSRSALSAVTSHTKRCTQCQASAARIASPEAILGALAPVGAIGAFKAGLLGSVLGGAGLAAGAAGVAAGGAAGGAAAGAAGGAGGGVAGPAGIAVGVAAAVAAVAGALFALGLFDSSPQPAALEPSPTPIAVTTTPTPTATPVPPTPTPQPPTPTPTPSPSPTVVVAAAPTTLPLPERFLVSALGVDAPVTQLGLIQGGGRMDAPDGPDEVAWYSFTAKPGEPGNAVFSGHYDFFGVGPAVFYNLKDVQVGDELTIQLLSGQILRYRVTSSIVYATPTMPMNEILALDSTAETITLITCSGIYINGDYTHRLVVVAARIR